MPLVMAVGGIFLGPCRSSRKKDRVLQERKKDFWTSSDHVREDVFKDPETRLTIRTEISEDEVIESQPSPLFDSLDDIFGAVPELHLGSLTSDLDLRLRGRDLHRFRIHPMVRVVKIQNREGSFHGLWIFSRLSCSGLEVREDHVPDDGGVPCNSDQVIAQEPRHR